MRRFLVIIEKAGDNYSAYTPELPGCIATGRTKEETKRRMREAIRQHLELLEKEKLPVPEVEVSVEYAIIE